MLQYDVPEYKKIRVIVDTDAACEADDPFAIAHALMCRKFDVKAILAEHFGGKGTVQRSMQEIETVLNCMDRNVPLLMGEDGPLSATKDAPLSAACAFLIHEAMKEDEKPLFVLCLGAITNVARAMMACPEIKEKMTVVWIGCQDPDRPNPHFREFNAGNDIEAANFVLGSGADVWLLPVTVYGKMRIGLAEIQKRIYPCGRIGKHLFEQMVAYNGGPHAGWTAGESWTLGDNPAIGVALDPSCGSYTLRTAPVVQADTTCSLEAGRPLIRVYDWVDSRFVLEDMMCKLEILYGQKK